jgi:hypothetical protein
LQQDFAAKYFLEAIRIVCLTRNELSENKSGEVVGATKKENENFALATRREGDNVSHVSVIECGTNREFFD